MIAFCTEMARKRFRPTKHGTNSLPFPVFRQTQVHSERERGQRPIVIRGPFASFPSIQRTVLGHV